jgi:cobalt-zinc-cadmium efflux system outer membrane protein
MGLPGKFAPVFFLSGALLTSVWAGAAPARAQGGAGGGAAGGAGAGAAGAAGAGHGAPAQGTSSPAGQAGANGQAGDGQAGQQTTAQSYAAGATLTIDPRTPAPAKPGALTLRQVLDAAEARNPTLLAARRNLDAVHAQEMQAAVRTNPSFNLNTSNVTEPQYVGNPDSYVAQFSRLFERGDKRHWRIETAVATTSQTRAQLQDQTRTILFQVKQAFFTMLIAKQSLELSSATLKDFRHEVEISNDRYKAGDLGKLDFERLDLQLGSFESDESNATVTLQQASAQLQNLMGIDTPKADFDITNVIVPPAIHDTQDSLVQAALLSRPDYAAARSAVLAAEANARLAIANGTADPTLEVEYDRTGHENSLGAYINIPIRIFDRNQGNKATARFQADASHFTEVAARNQVISDVTQSWVGYTQAKRLADRFSEHYLDESRDVLSIAQYAFEHGGIALIDYLDALRDARSSTSEALNAYLQTWLAIEQLSSSAATELIP